MQFAGLLSQSKHQARKCPLGNFLALTEKRQRHNRRDVWVLENGDFDRQKLFEEVSAMPITRLAEVFGLADVGVRKKALRSTCRCHPGVLGKACRWQDYCKASAV